LRSRPSDLVVRLGGDEFAIVQSLRFARIEAQALAERICRELAQPFEVGNAKVVIGTSVGIGLATEDASSASELLKSADLALYAAKADDKGGFRFYDAGMTRAVHERADIENGLRWAIDNEELRLFYQPIVCLKEQKTVGYEALIRWIRPELGMVSPLDFIPVAEETGMIVKIEKPQHFRFAFVQARPYVFMGR
jgi:predicted signal transduction protein with EAL and GGDEF domain